MNDLTHRAKRTAKDFATDQEVRWCPGCGDYAILRACRKPWPTSRPSRQNTVFVSGIGCAARFPYYIETYGFHTIHGRAPRLPPASSWPIPNLDVWVVRWRRRYAVDRRQPSDACHPAQRRCAGVCCSITKSTA